MTEIRAEDVARTAIQIFPLIGRLMDLYMRYSDRGLSMIHFEVLIQLTAQPLTVTDLAERHNISAASVSKTVTVLEERGWLTRTRSSEDRRVVLLRLTEAGQAVLDDVQRQTLDSMTGLFSQLSPEERESIVRGLETLFKAFAIAMPPQHPPR
jgi:DNA-binding MarR family transcriptional regulator